MVQPNAQPSGGLKGDRSILLVAPAIQKFRCCVLQLLAIVVPLGFASKFYAGPAQFWVGGHFGGILYVAFWILLVLLIWPTLSSRLVAFTVLGITCVLEVLQLWQPSALGAVRSTFMGHALIGSTFSWWDFPNYVLGSILGVLLVRWARGRASRRQHSEPAA